MRESIEEIMDKVKERKKGRRKRVPNPQKPISIWSENDIIDNEKTKALVVILNTTGCSWAKESGCTMCGYHNDTNPHIKKEDLYKQLSRVEKRYQNEKYLKIFTSGSYLNSLELPMDFAKGVLELFSGKCRRICVESRIEYITDEWLEWLSELPCQIEIAVGLESSNEMVRNGIINKNISFEEYRKKCMNLKDNNILIKTYLLLKPPFLTEKQGIEDCTRSIEDIIELTHTISINPVNVQNFTLVDHLHFREEYRPPWIHSLAEVFKRSWDLAERKGVRLMSSPSGGGSRRGVHNCGVCDKEYLKLIEGISMKTASIEDLNTIFCTCYNQWIGHLYSQEPLIDLEN